MRFDVVKNVDGRWLRGSLVLFPYLVVYLAGWALDLPTSLVRSIFLVLHLLLAGYLLVVVVPFVRRADRVSLLFWSGLAAFFLLPGALLEFPLDPWDHLQRIYFWDAMPRISSFPWNQKFHYFWVWSTLSWLDLPARRIALDLHSALCQFALALQFYRFVRRLGFERSWAYLQVVGFILFFGYDFYAWFRHEALSSSLPAFIAYFESLIVLLEWRVGNRRNIWTLIPLVLLMRFNHLEELALFSISATLLVAFQGMTRLRPVARRRVGYLLGGIFLLSLVGGARALAFHPALFGVIKPSGLSSLGTFRFWTMDQPFLLLLWIPGFLGLGGALFVARRYPIIALLTLGPPILLLWPPFVILVGNLLPSGPIASRLLFAFPQSIALVAALRDLPMDRLLRADRRLVALVLLLLLGAFPHHPLRGKLFLQIHRPDPMRELVYLDETAVWLRKNRPALVAKRNLFLADHATELGLASLLANSPYSSRGIYSNRMTEKRVDEILAMMDRGDFAAILVPDKARMPPTPYSAMNRYGGWQGMIDLWWLKTEAMTEAGETLVHFEGWRRTDVPPFFVLYEPPSTGERR